LLSEIAPGLKRAAIMFNPEGEDAERQCDDHTTMERPTAPVVASVAAARSLLFRSAIC
jgi:hypothetical protein